MELEMRGEAKSFSGSVMKMRNDEEVPGKGQMEVIKSISGVQRVENKLGKFPGVVGGDWEDCRSTGDISACRKLLEWIIRLLHPWNFRCGPMIDVSRAARVVAFQAQDIR